MVAGSPHSLSWSLFSGFLWGGSALFLGFLARSLSLRYLRRCTVNPDLLHLFSRVSQYWVWILGGYVFLGSTPASPIWFLYVYRALNIFLILSVTVVCAKGSAILVRNYLRRRHPQLPSGSGVYVTLQAGIGAVGGIILFQYLGFLMMPALAIMGIMAIASLLAFYETLINLAAGLHLLIERPFRLGDHIRLGSGEEGEVTAIQWRTTRIQSSTQQVIIVPNRKIVQSTIQHIYPARAWDAVTVRDSLSAFLAGRPFVLVSNREPYVHQWMGEEIQWSRPAGGVTAALDPLLQAVGGLWVAWGSGDADRETSSPDGKVAVPPDQPSYTLKRVWLNADELDRFYAGYSNGVIWPLCHLALDKVEYREADWEAYRQVNRRFAEGVFEEVSNIEGVVWVHDYQLALVPQYLREKNPCLKIYHFWHIPWPPFDLYRALPQRKEIIEGLLSADLIGFQVDRYRENFSQCAKELLGVEANGTEITYSGHRTVLRTLPISIDFDQFTRWASAPDAEQEMKRIRQFLGLPPEGFIGIGVDRLEYTKALVERFEAISLFLKRYPEYLGRFTFVQVAPSSRNEMEVYREYSERVRHLVERINKEYAREEWTPIHFMQEKLDHPTLALYYRMADLAIISSTADGMNLVAKEYVASQVDEKGVLLLSEMSGASEQLEGTFLINPYDTESLCEAIRTSLGIPLPLKGLLMRRIREQVRTNTLYRWVGETFVSAD